jgi:hypothetical protein
MRLGVDIALSRPAQSQKIEIKKMNDLSTGLVCCKARKLYDFAFFFEGGALLAAT